MYHKALPLFTLLSICACSRSGDITQEAAECLATDPAPRSYGALIEECDPPQGTRAPGAPATGIYDHGGCKVYSYTSGQFGELVPPGWTISYCVCQDMPSNDPLTGPLEGGWTYPIAYCSHDWSNH